MPDGNSLAPYPVWGRKDHIPRFRDAESIRRKAFMPEFMMRTVSLPTSWSILIARYALRVSTG